MVDIDFFSLFKLWSPTKDEIKTDFYNYLQNITYKDGKLYFKDTPKISLTTEKETYDSDEIFTLNGFLSIGKGYIIKLYNNDTLIDTLTTTDNGKFTKTINNSIGGTNNYKAVFEGTDKYGFVSTNLTVFVNNVRVECMELGVTGSSFSSGSTTPFTYTGQVYVDWGDNTGIVEYTGGILSHNYGSSGNRTVKIYGNITALERNCFKECTGLTSIDIPNTVTNFVSSCFYGCTNLTSITIPNTVTHIGNYCFYDCTGLTELILEWEGSSEIITYNSNWITRCTSFDHFLIPQDTKSLYIDKGYPSNLLRNSISLSADKSVVINGDSFTLKGYVNTKNPINVDIYKDNHFIETVQTDSNGEFELTILPNQSEDIFTQTISYTAKVVYNSKLYTSENVSITILAHNYIELEFTGDTFNSSNLFSENDGEFILPINTVIDWGDDSELEEYTGGQLNHTYASSDDYTIRIYGYIANIDNYAFDNCTGLTSITLQNSVTKLGDYCFSNSGLTSIDIPNSVSTMGESVFDGCVDLTEIKLQWNSNSSIIPYDDTWINDCSSFNHFLIPMGTTNLYVDKGYPSNLLQIDGIIIPPPEDEPLPNLGDSNISLSTNKNSVSIGETFTLTGVLSLGKGYTVKLYDGNTFIKDIITGTNGLFSETITGAGVGKIHLYSARYDEYKSMGVPVSVVSAKTVFILEITGNSFSIGSGLTYTDTVMVDWGDGTASEYDNGANHTYQTNGSYTIYVDGSVSSLSDGLFQNVSNLNNVYIKNGITALNNSTFAGCSNLKIVSLPNTLTSIGANCFMSNGLTSITIPRTVSSIGSNCFRFCFSLKEIVLKWNNSNEIVTYNASWINSCSSFDYFNIPTGTLDLYIDKGYPIHLLYEGG